MVISVLLNSNYRFTFIEDFIAFNGVYVVTQIATYTELMNADVDLFTYFYQKLGKTTEQYSTDIGTYKSDRFFKLTDVTDSTNVIIIPESIIASHPEPDIAEYAKLVLSIDLGVVGDTSLLTSLLISVSEVIAASQGITIAPVITKYGSQWLSSSEYAAVVAARETKKRAVINYFSECNRLTADAAKKNAKIVSLQKLVAALSANQKQS